jgi:hypothetical protein
MIKSVNKVDVYEVDGNIVSVGASVSISVESHWNDDKRVNIIIGKKSYTVLAKDLRAAIENATNTRRW